MFRKVILTAFALLAVISVAYAAEQGRTGLGSDVSTDFADSSDITAAELRGVMTDVIDSGFNLTDDGIGDISDIDLTGVAFDDLMYYSGGSWYAKSLNEFVDANTSLLLGGATAVGGANSIAIGSGAQTGSSGQQVAIGWSTSADGLNATALGSDADATGNTSIALGYQTDATAVASIAIGNNTTDATALRAVALGAGAVADQTDCVALGNGSNCDAINTVYINGTTDSLYVGDALTVVGQSRVPSPMTEKVNDYTITAADLGGTLVYNSSGAGTFTIPDGLAVNNGDMVGFVQAGAGTLSFVSSGTMDLNSYDGFAMLGEDGVAVVQFQSASKAFISGHLN